MRISPRPLLRYLVPVIVILFLMTGSSKQSEASGFSIDNDIERAFENPNTAFVQGQIIVKMKGDGDIRHLQTLNTPRILNVKSASFGYKILHIDGDVLESCKQLNNNPDVESAEPNYLRFCNIIPDDPRWSAQRNLYLSNAPAGWDIETGKSDVIVAVIDTGVDYNHPELAPNLLPGKNFVGVGDYMDDSGHGTAVSGVIGAVGNNSEGMAGAAWNIRILPLRACGGPELSCSVSTVAEAIEEAIVQGADVINMSLGGTNSSQIEKTAIDTAWNTGIIIFAAVGNEGKLGKFGDPELEQNLAYPAAYENVCGVSSIDYPIAGDLTQIHLSSFSNSGDAVSVTAVGSRVVTTVPTVDVPFAITKTKNYVTINGTSFSAPLVSGLAALIKSHFPEMSNREIRTRVESAVWDIGPQGWDDDFGYGLVDFRMALMGGRYASNEAFNLGVSASPILNDDLVVIVKTKQQLSGAPTVLYQLMGQFGPIYFGSLDVIRLEWNTNIYVGRLHTTHQGGIIFKINGNGTGGPVPELVMEYYKIDRP